MGFVGASDCGGGATALPPAQGLGACPLKASKEATTTGRPATRLAPRPRRDPLWAFWWYLWGSGLGSRFREMSTGGLGASYHQASPALSQTLFLSQPLGSAHPALSLNFRDAGCSPVLGTCSLGSLLPPLSMGRCSDLTLMCPLRASPTLPLALTSDRRVSNSIPHTCPLRPTALLNTLV